MAVGSGAWINAWAAAGAGGDGLSGEDGDTARKSAAQVVAIFGKTECKGASGELQATTVRPEAMACGRTAAETIATPMAPRAATADLDGQETGGTGILSTADEVATPMAPRAAAADPDGQEMGGTGASATATAEEGVTCDGTGDTAGH